MEQAKLKVCRQKASLAGPAAGRHTASGRPFPPALLLPMVPIALVSLFFLAGSGMMLEVELTWLLDFANSTPGACLSSCPPALCPWGLAEDLVSCIFPASQEAGWGSGSVWQPGWVSAEPRVSLVKHRGGSH